MSQLGGIDWVTVQQALQRWVVAGSGLPADHVYWGQQDSPRVVEPAIEMRIYNQVIVGEPWVDRESNPLVVSPLTVSVVDPSDDTLAISAHGLVTGDGPVRFSTTGTMPGGIVASTDYWIVVSGANSVQIASSYFATGGNHLPNPIQVIDITSTGTGVLTLLGQSGTIRAGQEIVFVGRAMERCTLNLECHTTAGVGMNMAIAVLHNIVGRQQLPSQHALLAGANIGVIETEHVRAVHGIRNAVMFEPRAILQVHLSIPSEVFELGTIIQRATGTNLLTGRPFVSP